MSCFSFNPYDSDTWPDPEEEGGEFDQPPEDCCHSGQIPESKAMYPLPQISLPSSSEEEEEITVVSEDNYLALTDAYGLHDVVATGTGYTGDKQISKHLSDVNGLIILPIEALSMIRRPGNFHKMNPKIMVFLSDGTSPYKDFEDAVKTLKQ